METTGTTEPWRQRLTSSWCKASMSWQELQVVVCYRAFLPSCPSRKWELLSFFFPRSYVPFLARKCVPHLLPTFRYLLRGAVAIQHSYYPKKVSFRLRAWKLPWGAASASDWSCKGYWCAPWVLCSLQSLFWAAACPFFRGEKGTGYQHPYLRIVSKVFPSSLWACLQEMVRAHSEVLWYTVYSVQGV